MNKAAEPVLSIENLTTRLKRGAGEVDVLKDVSLKLHAGRITGILGESGSGKTLLALSVLKLLPRVARISAGHVMLGGRDIAALPEEQFQNYRGTDIAIAPQDAGSALNPVRTIWSQLHDVLKMEMPSRDARLRAVELLAEVGLPEPETILSRYAFELSGGMRQRAMIALALTRNPKVLFADEPTTALDATVQAKILALLRRLCHQRGLAIALITHDLGIIARAADEAVVMYAGQIVEHLALGDLFSDARMPYTQSLIAARPQAHGHGRLAAIPGHPPDPSERPVGCAFHPRCPVARPDCAVNEPVAERVNPTHRILCHHWRSGDLLPLQQAGAGHG